MMKKIRVIVKKRFLDGSTGLYRNPGDKMTIPESRYIEIIRKGDYVEAVKDTAPTTPGKTEIKK